MARLFDSSFGDSPAVPPSNVPAGPAWATFSEDEYAVENGSEAMVRYHTLEISGRVLLAQKEHNRGGVVTLDPLVVNIHPASEDGDMWELDEAGACRLAAALLNALDKVAEIAATEKGSGRSGI